MTAVSPASRVWAPDGWRVCATRWRHACDHDGAGRRTPVREYRERAARGDLPVIAPRRFNPTGERWLPILHTTRGDRHYTALFSNTATAHRLGRTRDWVVIYLDGADGDHPSTVVTESRGLLGRRRVVRGRESECITHYHLDAFTHFVPLGSAVYG